MIVNSRTSREAVPELARVLVVNDDPASRITLQTVLEAGGYRVDGAATAAEAVGKMQDHQYQLVLSDLQMESPEAGLRVIAHAQLMKYAPATALVTTWQNSRILDNFSDAESILVATQDIPGLLTKVALLISTRATRMVERELRLACRYN
ncbi:MAG: response regulator [Bryobacteraceae bacterium]|nr:response regulator [Bryobacteraceae bacterium]